MRSYLHPELAWIAFQWGRNERSQVEIARELNCSPSAVCCAIKRFCDLYGGVDVSNGRYYGPERWQITRQALRSYELKTGSLELFRPDRQPDGYSLTHPDPKFRKARAEHAFLLRCEGLTYKEVGQHLGVCGQRARDLVHLFSRVLNRATRKAWVCVKQEQLAE